MSEVAAPAPVPETREARYVTDDALLSGLDGNDFSIDDAIAGPESVNAYETPKDAAADVPPPASEPAAEPGAEANAVNEAVDQAAEEALAKPKEPEILPSTKGTREDPLTLKDLPEDKWIKVKVDGETQLVSLREAMEGAYLRPQAFDRLLSKANRAKTEAEQIARDAVEHQSRFRQGFDLWIRDPGKVFSMMLDQHEEVLEQVAIKYAELRKSEAENPMLRQQRIFAAQNRKIQEERQRTQQERQEWETRRAREEAASAALRELKPGYEAGLKELGFPNVTAELSAEIRARLQVARAQRGGAALTAGDVRDAVVRAGRYLGIAPAAAAAPAPASAPARPAAPAPVPPARPRPAPAPMATPQRPPPNGNNGVSRWDNVSQARRFQDPDFFWGD